MSTRTESPSRARPSYRWAAAGDVNAFFGLMLDNIGDMILMATLLIGIYGFPKEFVLTRMIPGTAIGVLVGDLIFTAMAFGLAKKSGRSDVTAMPLGLDTPSTFGAVFLILGPAFRAVSANGADIETAAKHAWFIGIAMIVASGIFKLACALVSGWIRRHVPRAGLLGSLTSIALVLISFLPLLEIAAVPASGFAALAVILATLTARRGLPWKIPGALGALIAGCLALGLMNLGHYLLNVAGWGPWPFVWSEGTMPPLAMSAALPIPVAEWLGWIGDNYVEAASYLPVAIPLALATVVGGIDCTESAAAAGDNYPTGPIIAAEGIATLIGGLFGGVIQSTPYIGHPAYKAMGARAAYTLATALFVGGAGVLGYFDWIFFLLPKSVVFPILIFVGLEITAQSFRATPRKHYPALALACIPALAYLVSLQVDRVAGESGKAFWQFSGSVQQMMETTTVLSGGFIITSLLWATAMAKMIDGRMRTAAAAFAIAGVFSLFGVIHSPLPDSPIVSPQEAIRRLRSPEVRRFEAAILQTPYHWAGAYAGMAVISLAIGRFGKPAVELPSREQASAEPEATPEAVLKGN